MHKSPLYLVLVPALAVAATVNAGCTGPTPSANNAAEVRKASPSPPPSAEESKNTDKPPPNVRSVMITPAIVKALADETAPEEASEEKATAAELTAASKAHVAALAESKTPSALLDLAIASFKAAQEAHEAEDFELSVQHTRYALSALRLIHTEHAAALAKGEVWLGRFMTAETLKAAETLASKTKDAFTSIDAAVWLSTRPADAEASDDAPRDSYLPMVLLARTLLKRGHKAPAEVFANEAHEGLSRLRTQALFFGEHWGTDTAFEESILYQLTRFWLDDGDREKALAVATFAADKKTRAALTRFIHKGAKAADLAALKTSENREALVAKASTPAGLRAALKSLEKVPSQHLELLSALAKASPSVSESIAAVPSSEVLRPAWLALASDRWSQEKSTADAATSAAVAKALRELVEGHLKPQDYRATWGPPTGRVVDGVAAGERTGGETFPAPPTEALVQTCAAYHPKGQRPPEPDTDCDQAPPSAILLNAAGNQALVTTVFSASSSRRCDEAVSTLYPLVGTPTSKGSKPVHTCTDALEASDGGEAHRAAWKHLKDHLAKGWTFAPALLAELLPAVEYGLSAHQSTVLLTGKRKGSMVTLDIEGGMAWLVRPDNLGATELGRWAPDIEGVLLPTIHQIALLSGDRILVAGTFEPVGHHVTVRPFSALLKLP